MRLNKTYWGAGIAVNYVYKVENEFVFLNRKDEVIKRFDDWEAAIDYADKNIDLIEDLVNCFKCGKRPRIKVEFILECPECGQMVINESNQHAIDEWNEIQIKNSPF